MKPVASSFYFILHKDNGSTSYLLYVICGLANATVFISHTALPGIPLRKRLLEIVRYFFGVFGENSIAVLKYCCQDIESERKRCALYDCQVHSLFSPKTKQITKDVRKRTVQIVQCRTRSLCHKGVGYYGR